MVLVIMKMSVVWQGAIMMSDLSNSALQTMIVLLRVPFVLISAEPRE